MPAKDRDQRLRTQREYEAKMKALRAAAPPPPSEPIYDPRRAPPPVWSDLTAYVMGDPPLTRSALCRKGAGAQ
jgi:hypothetical protein